VFSKPLLRLCEPGRQRQARVERAGAGDTDDAAEGIHTLAQIMGTSVGMIERHYGKLDGALESLAGQLHALDVRRDRAASEAADDV
jgi:hypothetical protein